jgi:hypothetical protein
MSTHTRRNPVNPTLPEEKPGGAGPPGLGSRLTFALPVVLPAALAGYAVVAMLALLAGHFSAGLVLPIGIAAGVGTGAVALRAGLAEAGGWDGKGRWADLVAVVGSVGWLGANLPFSSQRINLFRDPALYADTAVYLTHHPALPIQADGAVFGLPHPAAALNFGSTGFAPLADPDHIQAQGAHLLQTLLASAGWIGGNRALFDGNLVIGAVALLAVYGLGRRVIAPWWAMGATSILAISLPMLEFSRATFTEPLAMLFVWGGLALLVAAHRTRALSHFAAAGLTFGATAMTRIDGLLTLLSVIAYAAVVLGGAVLRRQRRPAVELAAFVLPVLLAAVLAVRDLQSLAAKYYHDLGSQVREIRLGAIGLLAVSVVVVAAFAVVAERVGPGRQPAADHRRARSLVRALPYAGGGLVVLAMVFLGIRRLWFASHNYAAISSYIEFLQKARHLTIDGSRTYSELTVTWLVWYVGIVAVVIGIAGLGLVTASVLRSLRPPLVLGLAAWVLAAYYLYSPNIFADQIWGVRRLLPVVLPGLLLAGGAVVAVVAGRGRLGMVVACLLAAVVVVQTVVAGGRLALIRQDTPQLAEAQALCRALPRDAAVVVTADLTNTYLQPVRSFCDVPAAGLAGAATAPGLSGIRVAAARAGRRLYALSSVAGSLPGVPKTAKPFSSIKWRAWNATLTSPPDFAGTPSRRFWLGQIEADGTVTQVGATGPGG